MRTCDKNMKLIALSTLIIYLVEVFASSVVLKFFGSIICETCSTVDFIVISIVIFCTTGPLIFILMFLCCDLIHSRGLGWNEDTSAENDTRNEIVP